MRHDQTKTWTHGALEVRHIAWIKYKTKCMDVRSKLNRRIIDKPTYIKLRDEARAEYDEMCFRIEVSLT